jgi:hypothetical protein
MNKRGFVNLLILSIIWGGSTILLKHFGSNGIVASATQSGEWILSTLLGFFIMVGIAFIIIIGNSNPTEPTL